RPKEFLPTSMSFVCWPLARVLDDESIQSVVRETSWDLTRIARCAERLLKFFQEKLHVVFRRQRTHHANAEDFPCERSKASSDLDARPIEQLLADLGFVRS